MASRVNIKLVAVLIVGLVAVGVGGIYVYFSVLNKSAADNAAAADKAMAEGDYALAKRMIARAVNKEPNNVEYLKKWRAAIEAWQPASETDFENEFRTAFVPMLRGLALAQPDNVDAAHEYLRLLYEQVTSWWGFDANGVQEMDSETAQLLVRMQSVAGGSNRFLTIRRYRGLTYADMLRSGRVVPEEKQKLAEEDLRAVLDADGSDGGATVGLMRLLESRAREAKAAGRREQFAQLRAEEMKLLDDHLARDPEDPEVLLNKLALQIDIATDKAVEGKVGPDATRALIEAQRSFEPQVVELARKLATTKEPLDRATVVGFQRIEQVVIPQNNLELTLDIVDNLLAQKGSDDAESLMLKSQVLTERRDFQAAADVLAQVTQLPPLPVGAKGMRLNWQRRTAFALRAEQELAYLQSLPEDDETGRTAALERAVAARNEYAKRVPEDNPNLLYLDASITLAKGDLRKAQNLIQRFNQVTNGSDLRGLWFEGQVSRQLGEYGRAKAAFERVRAAQPNNVSAIAMVALMERALQNPQAALGLYRELARLAPDDQSVRQAINELEVELGITESDDPVVQVLTNAKLALAGKDGRPGSISDAIAILRAGAEANNYAPRIVLQLANYLLNTNDIQSAREVVEASWKLYPNDEKLALVREALKSDDVFGVTMMLIDSADAPEVEKLVNKYTLCQMNGRAEQAKQILDQLSSAYPDDYRVIELRFLDALGQGDLDKARAVYESAMQKGLLSYDGLTFRARLESAEGKHADAINTLNRAIEQGANQAFVWRLLGSEQAATGQYSAAADSFRKACEIQPNDIQNVKPLLEVLSRTGQLDEALRRAREAEKFGRSDPQFVNLWLQLEAKAGGQDGIARAILVREQRAKLDKSDVVNLMELASLYMDVASSSSGNVTPAAKKENWEKARAIIDDLKARSPEPDLRVVILDARWHADQGRVTHPDGTVTDGIEDARGIFVEYIVNLGDKATAVPYIELARFMTQRGRYAIARQALEGAREFQSDQLEADKVLAALNMELGQYAEAEPLSRKIVESGADGDDESYRIRWIEVLLRQGKYEEANAQLAKVNDQLKDSLTVLLQRAEAADGLGNQQESARLLDRAVAMYSDVPLPYTRRAEFKMRHPELINDVLADLQQALKLKPDDPQTLRLRAGVYGSLERYDDMLEDLKAALRANPYQTEVLQAILVEYILRGQDGRAMDVVEETLRARPRDLMLLARAGRIFDERALWERSATLYERGWQLSGDPGFALAYINALISQTPPKTQIADRVLRELKAMGDAVTSQWTVGFAESAIMYRAGRKADAEKRLAEQFPVLAADTNELSKWWTNLRGLYANDSKGLETFVRTLLAQASGNELNQTWAKLFLAQLLVQSEQGKGEGHELLASLMTLKSNDGSPSGFALLAYRQAGAAFYADEEYEKAVETWKRGLEVFPGDWEMNNNAAYALATKLNRPSEALPFAQAAVAANPEQAEVYDTMARVHLAMKDLTAASADLDLARKYVRSKRAEMSVTLTQCELDFQNGQYAKARRVLERALLGVTPLPDLREEFEAPIRDLLRRIDSLQG
ncbi:MAG: hypothetical protein Kow0022_07330 [Phycisphaerales bacterium]